jgi:hypothetical protein
MYLASWGNLQKRNETDWTTLDDDAVDAPDLSLTSLLEGNLPGQDSGLTLAKRGNETIVGPRQRIEFYSWPPAANGTRASFHLGPKRELTDSGALLFNRTSHLLELFLQNLSRDKRDIWSFIFPPVADLET